MKHPVYLYIRDGAVGIVILYKFDSLELRLRLRQEVLSFSTPVRAGRCGSPILLHNRYRGTLPGKSGRSAAVTARSILWRS
jgi:hypothetical protein